MRFSVLALIAPAAVLITALAAPPATRPPTGWSTQARVVRVLDGDTIEVEVSHRVKVRLLDCWAPESHQPAGPASTANLKRLLGDGEITLLVPTDGDDVSSLWTFGRVLGYVWSTADADKSVSQLQVEQGHATREKQR